ncbi:phosphonate transport system ATP-binding protein [Bradyrhizobium sp. USDA 4369]
MRAATATTMGAPILQVENLSKRYGERRVIEDLSFSIGAGELVVLLGPSGSGKTTLFKVITRLVPPDAGQLTFAGAARLDELEGRALREVRREIGFIFQQFNLIKRMTALQNVLVGRLGYTSTWRVLLRHFLPEDIARAEAALDEVGLADFRHQRVDCLSGGQQQRVAIARALAQECRFILADEPVASLDPESARNVLETLRAVAHDRGLAVLCSLHQTDLALDHADRVIGLREGRVVIDAPVCDVNAGWLDAIYGKPVRQPSSRSAPRPKFGQAILATSH